MWIGFFLFLFLINIIAPLPPWFVWVRGFFCFLTNIIACFLPCKGGVYYNLFFYICICEITWLLCTLDSLGLWGLTLAHQLACLRITVGTKMTKLSRNCYHIIQPGTRCMGVVWNPHFIKSFKLQALSMCPASIIFTSLKAPCNHCKHAQKWTSGKSKFDLNLLKVP